jgi:hypothetical protein
MIRSATGFGTLRTFFGKKSSVTYPIAILAGSLLVRLPAAGTAKKTSRAAACCSISSQVGPQDQNGGLDARYCFLQNYYFDY